jgi:hypothetical protein
MEGRPLLSIARTTGHVLELDQTMQTNVPLKIDETGKQRAKEDKAAADAHAKALEPTIRELR